MHDHLHVVHLNPYCIVGCVLNSRDVISKLQLNRSYIFIVWCRTIGLLNLDPTSPNVCHSKPVGIIEPATFAVANKSVGKLNDVRQITWECDSTKESRFDNLKCLGCHQGKCTVQSNIQSQEPMYISWYMSTTITNRQLLFAALYFTSLISYFLKLAIIYVWMHTGTSTSPLTIVQYSFSNSIFVPIKMAPHGNCTTSNRLYCHTQPSTLYDMKHTSDL